VNHGLMSVVFRSFAYYVMRTAYFGVLMRLKIYRVAGKFAGCSKLRAGFMLWGDGAGM
jgi:hypothetical protein